MFGIMDSFGNSFFTQTVCTDSMHAIFCTSAFFVLPCTWQIVFPCPTARRLLALNAIHGSESVLPTPSLSLVFWDRTISLKALYPKTCTHSMSSIPHLCLFTSSLPCQVLLAGNFALLCESRWTTFMKVIYPLFAHLRSAT